MPENIIEKYMDSYKLFCETVVHQRLTANQEVLMMSKLTQLLTKLIGKQQGVDVPSIR